MLTFTAKKGPWPLSREKKGYESVTESEREQE